MQIITTAIIKGGTGKTTTALALAQAAAADKKRVLLIDLDPQGNASFYAAADRNAPGSYELLHGADPAQLIQHTSQGLAVISGSPDLATDPTKPGSAKRLAAALDQIKRKYDLIVIDTPPTIGEMTYNALQASTGLIIPMESDLAGVHGIFQITEIAQQMQRRNPDLKILGVVLTRFDTRPKINRYIQETIQQQAEEMGAPYLMAIRPGVAIREAQALRQSIYDYAPRSKPAQDYQALYKLIRKRGR